LFNKSELVNKIARITGFNQTKQQMKKIKRKKRREKRNIYFIMMSLSELKNNRACTTPNWPLESE
jgi:hypothetical protein